MEFIVGFEKKLIADVIVGIERRSCREPFFTQPLQDEKWGQSNTKDEEGDGNAKDDDNEKEEEVASGDLQHALR